MKATLYNRNRLFVLALAGLIVIAVYLCLNNINIKTPEDALYVKNLISNIDWRMKIWL